jgi:lipoyl(octanoyl) transferase
VNTNPHRQTKFIDLGLIDYQKALDFQTDLYNQLLAIKAENRIRDAEGQKTTGNFLIFCEHPHVFTLGRSGDEHNLLIGKEELSAIDARYYPINRGGDVTYHGPGQIVVYPVLDLENFFTDIHRYMRLLEESVIQTLQEFDIEAGRIPGLTGVWLDHDRKQTARKIAALGVKTSRWVTLHGVSFNVNTDLSYFDYIIPCGIPDKGVTSMKLEKGVEQDFNTVKEVLKRKLVALFEMELVYV